MVSIIAAMAEGNRAIGLRGGLPWRLPADMARFRGLTMGHAVIMGRATWEPIAGRGLPGRRVIVLSRSAPELSAANRRPEGADQEGEGGSDAVPTRESVVPQARSLDQALALARPDPEIFIAGGASVYQQALEARLVDRMYLTLIHAEFEGDRFFPEYDPEQWTVVSAEHRPADADNRFGMTFQTLQHRQPD